MRLRLLLNLGMLDEAERLAGDLGVDRAVRGLRHVLAAAEYLSEAGYGELARELAAAAAEIRADLDRVLADMIRGERHAERADRGGR